MKTPFCRSFGPLLKLAVLCCCVGTVFAWSPGVSSPNQTANFSVDTTNRRDVLSYFNCVYGASEGYGDRINWQGNVASLQAGTTSLTFKQDVLRRVNFYRALVGLSSDITLNLSTSAKDQAAALIFARNDGISHFPLTEHPNWIGMTDSGVEAAKNSNIAIGYYGPGAVDGYIEDDGDNNLRVGHRRWLFYSKLGEIGTGDIPADGDYSPANAIWVLSGFKSTGTSKFVAWPNAGYTPKPLIPGRWSLSYPNADFSSANVTMEENGKVIPVNIVSSSDVGYGDNTIVWEPQIDFTDMTADRAFTVTVSGIKGTGIVSSNTYEVNVFDPSQLGETMAIAGNSKISSGGGSFSFNPISQADSYELTTYLGSADPWKEGGESGKAGILPFVAPGYPVVQTQLVRSGTSALQLATPDTSDASFEDQVIYLSRRVLVKSTSKLDFYEIGRFAPEATTFHAEVSNDEGESWKSLWSRKGVGLSSSKFDAGWNSHSISLAEYDGEMVTFRFRMSRNGGSITTVSGGNSLKDFGFFVDDVSVSDAVELVSAKTTVLDSSQTGFYLSGSITGSELVSGATVYLSIAPRVGTRLYPSSALKAVEIDEGTGVSTFEVSLEPQDSVVKAGSYRLVSFAVTPAGSEVGSTSCELVRVLNGVETIVGKKVSVPESGVSSFALKDVKVSGAYKLRFTRTLIGGGTQSVDSEVFSVSILNFSDLAGGYEGSIREDLGELAENGYHRGKVRLDISRLGFLSGKLVYLESGSLSGTGNAEAVSYYVPVVRAFSGVFKEDLENPMGFVLEANFPAGGNPSREKIRLMLSYEAGTPKLRFAFEDNLSLIGAGLLEGDFIPVLKSVNDSGLGGMAGRYTVSSDSVEMGKAQKAYLLLQVLPSGSVAWVSKMAGYSGSGASGISKAASGGADAVFCETSVSNRFGRLDSRSYFGRILLSEFGDSSWGAFLGDAGGGVGLESYRTSVTKAMVSPSKVSVPVFQESAFSSGMDFSGFELVNFSDNDGALWWGKVPAVFGSNGRVELKVFGSGGESVYRWSIGMNARGVANVERLKDGSGVQAPLLNLRFDRLRGAWTGSYLDPVGQTRVSLFGVWAISAASASCVSVGWEERGKGAGLSIRNWRME